jgi:hypothetical protein
VSEERLAAAVDALLDELVGSGAEVGLQVAVVRHGPHGRRRGARRGRSTSPPPLGSTD